MNQYARQNAKNDIEKNDITFLSCFYNKVVLRNLHRQRENTKLLIIRPEHTRLQ